MTVDISQKRRNNLELEKFVESTSVAGVPAVRVTNPDGSDVTSGTSATQEVPLTSFGTLQQTVAAAGTPEQIPPHACKSMTVKALSTNTGLIYVGDATVTSANGFVLSASESVSMDVENTSLVYVDSSVNAEGVSVIYAN